MSYFTPDYFSVFEHIQGTTPAISYRGLSDRDRRLQIIQASNTKKVVKAIEKGYRDFNSLAHQQHQELAALERENIANQERTFELEEQQKELLWEQNELMEIQNSELQQQKDLMQLSYEQELEQSQLLKNLNFNIKSQKSVLESIDLRLLTMNEENLLMNKGLQDLIELVKIPDFEKERLFYFKESYKFLELAKKNPRRYSDALIYLKKAYELNPRDFVVNLEIGMIHLYDDANIDFESALYHFKLSLDYALDTTKYSLTATILLNLAYIYYLQMNFSKAQKFSIQASSLIEAKNIKPELALNSFQLVLECGMIQGDKKGVEYALNMYQKNPSLSLDLNLLGKLFKHKNYFTSPIFLFFEEKCKEILIEKNKNIVKSIKELERGDFEIKEVTLVDNAIKYKKDRLILKVDKKLKYQDLAAFNVEVNKLHKFAFEVSQSFHWVRTAMRYNFKNHSLPFNSLFYDALRAKHKAIFKAASNQKIISNLNKIEPFHLSEEGDIFWIKDEGEGGVKFNYRACIEDISVGEIYYFDVCDIWFTSKRIEKYNVNYYDKTFRELGNSMEVEKVTLLDDFLASGNFSSTGSFHYPPFNEDNNLFLLGKLENSLHYSFNILLKSQQTEVILDFMKLDVQAFGDNSGTKKINWTKNPDISKYDLYPTEDLENLSISIDFSNQDIEHIKKLLLDNQYKSLLNFYNILLRKGVEVYIRDKKLKFPVKTDEYKEYCLAKEAEEREEQKRNFDQKSLNLAGDKRNNPLQKNKDQKETQKLGLIVISGFIFLLILIALILN